MLRTEYPAPLRPEKRYVSHQSRRVKINLGEGDTIISETEGTLNKMSTLMNFHSA